MCRSNWVPIFWNIATDIYLFHYGCKPETWVQIQLLLNHILLESDRADLEPYRQLFLNTLSH